MPSWIGWPTMTFSVTPLSSSVSFATAASSRWLTVTSNAARERTLSFSPGNTVPADLLDFAFHTHHVSDKHDVTDIDKDTLFIEG